MQWRLIYTLYDLFVDNPKAGTKNAIDDLCKRATAARALQVDIEATGSLGFRV